MNIHEYQAKVILKNNGVNIQEGIAVSTPNEAIQAAKKLQEEVGTRWWVIKAQIHAGGRGKGGGVKLAKTLDEVETISNQMIGMNLVTHQTGPAGKTVHKVLITEDVYYPGSSQKMEFYMSVLLNRKTGKNVIKIGRASCRERV